jgi:hypothetical protein
MSQCDWRTPEFIARVNRLVSRDQYNRFRKIYNEPFYVLDIRPGVGGNGAEVIMSGSKAGSKYKMNVSPDGGGKVTCSCMDAVVNCRRLNCVCKHACFLAIRILRVSNVDVFFQRRGVLGMDGLREAERRANSDRLVENNDEDGRQTRRVTNAELDALCSSFSSSVNVKKYANDFSVVARPPGEGDECPVCYCELLGGPELVGCPDCGNGLHKACAERWLHHAPRRSCVYCRSDCWVSFGVVKKLTLVKTVG